MSKSLFIECNTGISGDMSVAALLDLGADRDVLNKMLESLKTVVGGFDVKITRVAKAGIGAADFDVILDNDNHDHDMDYLYGHDHNEHGHHHEHHHDHDGHHHHEHHHEHRSYLDVKAIIDKTEMTEGARNLAKKIFGIVAEAEAAVHDRPIDEVHFHEVGAVDSIVDILSAAVCFEDIITKNDIKKCIITRLVDGCGTVRCQHGVIPVPVPAVMKIAEQTGVRLAITERRGEFVTPTGAAFAAAVKTDDRLPESFSVLRVGIGAGKRDYEIPGMVRAMIIEA